MAITKIKLDRMLIDDLEYEPEEVAAMNEDEKEENFVGAGYLEDENAFAGSFDIIPAEFIDIEIVGDKTGWPVSLDNYYETIENE